MSVDLSLKDFIKTTLDDICQAVESQSSKASQIRFSIPVYFQCDIEKEKNKHANHPTSALTKHNDGRLTL